MWKIIMKITILSAVLIFDLFIGISFLINLLLNKKYVVETIEDGKGLNSIQKIISDDYMYAAYIILFNLLVVLILSLLYFFNKKINDNKAKI
jgi:hypothetical protein